MLESRHEAAEERDIAAVGRDQVADRGDDEGTSRDALSLLRDVGGDLRDDVASQRDVLADERDAAWRLVESSYDGVRDVSPTLLHDVFVAAGQALDFAAVDRDLAAVDRSSAGLDRASALADRLFGGDRRVSSATDRRASGEDRTESAGDRVAARFDGLSGAYSRESGLVELDREIVRARSTTTPLVVAYVEVDDLEDPDGPEPHVVLDGRLAAVVAHVRDYLVPYDIVVRMGSEDLLCVLSGFDLTGADQTFSEVRGDLGASSARGSLRCGFARLEADDSAAELILRARRDIPRS